MRTRIRSQVSNICTDSIQRSKPLSLQSHWSDYWLRNHCVHGCKLSSALHEPTSTLISYRLSAGQPPCSAAAVRQMRVRSKRDACEHFFGHHLTVTGFLLYQWTQATLSVTPSQYDSLLHAKAARHIADYPPVGLDRRFEYKFFAFQMTCWRWFRIPAVGQLS